MDERIIANFPSLTLEDTSSQPRRGDRKLTDATGAVSIMLEYKYYQNAVPGREVAKFERDARESAVVIAIMVAFDVHIANRHKQKLTFGQCDNTILAFLPVAGHDGTRLLATLDWAVWVCQQQAKRFHAPVANVAEMKYQSILQTSKDVLSKVDDVARGLNVVAEHIRHEAQRLDEVRLGHLTEIKTRLAMVEV